MILQIDGEAFAGVYYTMRQALVDHKVRMVAIAAKWPDDPVFANEVVEAEAAVQFVNRMVEQMGLGAV